MQNLRIQSPGQARRDRLLMVKYRISESRVGFGVGWALGEGEVQSPEFGSLPGEAGAKKNRRVQSPESETG